VAAPALRELVSFHTAEHIRDEIRRIDGSVRHQNKILVVPVQLTDSRFVEET